jgi:hypothetical protein
MKPSESAVYQILFHLFAAHFSTQFFQAIKLYLPSAIRENKRVPSAKQFILCAEKMRFSNEASLLKAMHKCISAHCLCEARGERIQGMARDAFGGTLGTLVLLMDAIFVEE